VFVSPLRLFAVGRCIDFLYVSRLKRGKTIVRTVTVTIDGTIKAALVPIDVIAIMSTCSYVYTDNATQIYFTLRSMSHRRRDGMYNKVYIEETKYTHLPFFFLSKRIFRKKIFYSRYSCVSDNRKLPFDPQIFRIYGNLPFSLCEADACLFA